MKNRLALLYITILVFYSSQSISASIEVVSGVVNMGSLTTSLSAGFRGSSNNSVQVFVDGFFGATDENGPVVENKQVTSSETSILVNEYGFIIDASVGTGSYIAPDYTFRDASAPVTGNLVFNVSNDGLFDYVWNAPENQRFLADANLSLSNLSGDSFLMCNTSVDCYDDTSTNTTGSVYLLAGEYTLAYSAFVGINAGTRSPSDINFSFQAAVPLPASVWLFISGLVGLFMRIR